MLRKYMSELGYTSEEIDKIINSYPIVNYVEDTLYKKIRDIFNFCIQYGYTSEDIIKMSVKFVAFYSYVVTFLLSHRSYG